MKIPDGWKKSKLGLYIDLLIGYPFKSKDYIYEKSGIRLIRGDNVIQGKIRWNDVKRWEIKKDSNIKKYYLKEKDFVIAMDRTWVKSGLKASLITSNDIPSLLVQRVARLRSKNGLYRNFLPNLIRSHKFEQYVKGVQTETAVPHISSLQIKEFSILLPPLPEQKAIAELLSTWDETIEKSKRLIVEKEKRFKWLINKLVFGQLRININSHEFINGHFFKYPKEWKYIRIKNIASELSIRNTDPENKLTVLSCSKYDGFVNSLDYFGKKVYSDDTSNYKIIKKGEFGYPANHIEEGSIGLLSHCEKGIVSPIYVTFNTDSEKVFQPFLYKILKTNL